MIFNYILAIVSFEDDFFGLEILLKSTSSKNLISI